jgi:hypothetical protein
MTPECVTIGSQKFDREQIALFEGKVWIPRQFKPELPTLPSGIQWQLET